MFKPRRSRTHVSLLTAYAGDEDTTLVIPEDLTALSDADLADLSTRAGEAFDAMYGDGTGLSAEDIAVLSDLTGGIEALAVETDRRAAEAVERDEAAAALAARAGRGTTLATEEEAPEAATEEDAPEEEAEEAEEEDEADAEADAEAEPELVTASAGARTINVQRAARRAPRPRPAAPAAPRVSDYVFSTADTLGLPANAGVDFAQVGAMLGKRLQSFSLGQYKAAADRGQHMREQHSLIGIKREVPKAFRAGDSMDSVQAAIDAARDQSRLPGGSLTAAGWCAPSEPVYDICYGNASRDGILSLPEVGVTRGGLLIPTGMSFADVYDNIGFHFTEQDAIDGKYAPGANPGDPNVVGDKPCYEVECPTWEDVRLEGDGICITADILQQKAYPEQLAAFTQQALIAHDHKINAGVIAKIVAGSTAVTMTTDTVGTTAPVLAAIELQVEHFRSTHRLSRSTLLEAPMPYWIRGAIRQDLSVRLGVDLLAVTNAQIDAWFSLRGIVPQYVYDWQDITGAATAFKQWPTTVSFLLYEAGTWIKGVDDIITIDSLYDSTQLGQNKYTALFTEEASLVGKVCLDSRVVTVPVCSDGTTHAGVLLDCDLSPTAAA